jgi:hypothetical protein
VIARPVVSAAHSRCASRRGRLAGYTAAALPSLANVASLAYASRQRGIDSIVVAGGAAFNHPLSFAFREDGPDLVNVFDHGAAFSRRRVTAHLGRGGRAEESLW